MRERLSRLGARLFVTLQYLLPHHLLSRIAGRLADTEIAWIKTLLIALFRRRYQVDLSEARIRDPGMYPSFNAFFTRALADDARPVAAEADAVVSPADGRVSQAGHLRGSDLIQAKGHRFSLFELLGGDGALAGEFINGHFATIYLSPRDYHRVHMPAEGTLDHSLYVPGRLFSVNETTTAQVPRLFARNERLITVFDSPRGPFAVIMVGAMIVAGIETVFSGRVTPGAGHIRHIRWPRGPVHLARGEELGRFLLGSTVILLFPPGRCEWREDFLAGASVRMGEHIGSLVGRE